MKFFTAEDFESIVENLAYDAYGDKLVTFQLDDLIKMVNAKLEPKEK